MQQTSEPGSRAGTVGDLLDRLEIIVGKVGLNTSEQAFQLLTGMDEAFERTQELEPGSQSRMLAETQLESIYARINREGGQFLRDLGGAGALQAARERRKPPEDHSWWYLDQLVANRRRASLRRTLTIAGIILGVLAVLVIVYNAFLAPDPQVAALYGHQQSAQDLMMNGDLQSALAEADSGLKILPNDGTLLITRGVILEQLQRKDEAQQAFASAEKAYPKREEYLASRSQAYLMSNQPEKALEYSQQASQIDPDYAQAYLMTGQAYETLRKYQDAMDAYEKAFDAAEKNQQLELAAITRTRMAMLLQMMNSQMPGMEITPTAAQ